MSGLSERIEPFRALLYNQDKIGALREVVAPPYDLIGPERQAELYARSPYNVVRLELGREADRYGAAAATMRQWRQAGVLRLFPRPAIYFYSQIFEVGGRKLRRDGLIARLRLEELGSGVLPHEKTFPAAKQDRLSLLTALRTNVSSIFGLYPEARLTRLYAEAGKLPVIAQVVDDLGIENQLRAIEEPAQIASVQRALAEGRILIADGHHRYETALNYRRARRQTEGDPAGLYAYDYTMMTLVACDDPGLVILPTHRIVARLERDARAAFAERAREMFALEEFAEPARMRAELARRGRGAIGVSLRESRACWILGGANRTALESAMAAVPAPVRELDVSILHALILDRIFGMKPEAVKAGGNIEYTIDAAAALDAVAAGRADGAFLMNPPSIEDVQRVSASGATMPEKSTYFHPKLITGLVLNPLE